jgi:hypothetical protein
MIGGCVQVKHAYYGLVSNRLDTIGPEALYMYLKVEDLA